MKLKVQDLKVYIQAKAKEKISHWVALAQGEVSGLGLVSEMRDDKGNLTGFVVDEVFLLKQVSGSASTILEDPAVAALLTELDGKGMDIGLIRLWWHSHGDLFDVFWSPTDKECADGLNNSRYFVSIVTNTKGAVLCRVDLYEPVRVVLDEVPVEVVMPDFGLLEECKAEFAAKVTEAEPLLACHGAYGYDQDDRITEKQYEQLIELEERLEQGLITYPEYIDGYEILTCGKLIGFEPKEDGVVK